MTGTVVRAGVHLTSLATVSFLALAVRQDIEVTPGSKGLLPLENTFAMTRTRVSQTIFWTCHDRTIVSDISRFAFACSSSKTLSIWKGAVIRATSQPAVTAMEWRYTLALSVLTDTTIKTLIRTESCVHVGAGPAFPTKIAVASTSNNTVAVTRAIRRAE